MEALYIQTNRLIQETQTTFTNLDRNCKSNVEDFVRIEAEISEKINTINNNCSKLETYVHKLPSDQRQNAKLRCDQLKYDSRHLTAGLAAYKTRQMRRQQVANEREELLNRRFAPNVTTINIDYGLQHQNQLTDCNRGVDEMLYTGHNTLESLRFQRDTLKGAKKRILDMANVLGLSNYTMRLIEKRASQDKYILVGGIVITLIIILIIIVYFV